MDSRRAAGSSAAQPGDVGLHRAGRVDRQVVRPDEVGQAQDVDGAPEVRRERGEQPPLTGGADPDRAGVPFQQQRPEDAERYHARIVAVRTAS